MRMEDTLNAAKDLDTVVREVREIVSGKEVTSYNVRFDFGKFLLNEPWNLDCTIPYDIMIMATNLVYTMVESDTIEDKNLQNRVTMDMENNPNKWIRSEDAFRIICPKDVAKLGGSQKHRALDDALREAYILRTIEHLRVKADYFQHIKCLKK